MTTHNRQVFPMTGEALKTFLKRLTEAPPSDAPCRCEIDGPRQATIFEPSPDGKAPEKAVAILRWKRATNGSIDNDFLSQAIATPPAEDEIADAAIAEDALSIRIVPKASYTVEIESPIESPSDQPLFMPN